MKTIEKQYNEAKEAFEEIERIYKIELQKDYLSRVFESLDEGLRNEVKNFNPTTAYPQKDVFIYCGHSVWAESIIFKRDDGKEKAILIDKDSDFDAYSISTVGEYRDPFFADYDEEHPELYNIEYNPIIKVVMEDFR